MIPYPNIKPEIFSIGPLSVRWYGLMYVVGYVIGFKLLQKRARQGLIRIRYAACESMITHIIIGMLLGARLVYALVYNWDYYSVNPLHIIRIWEGGLSFHGAALGMMVACAFFARKNKLRVYEVTDSLGYCAAPGLFFGRMGNFFNAELYGRATDVPWAMIFPTDKEQIPRHPSQLYQGITEGIVLFLVLFFYQRYLIKTGRLRHGLVGAMFLMGYGALRFGTEFFREPDAQLGFVLSSLSMGQVLCVLTVIAGIAMHLHSLKTMSVFKPKQQSEAELQKIS